MNSQAHEFATAVYAPESTVVAGLLHDENKRLRSEVARLTQENADLIHDNDLIMTACNAEANEAEKLRAELASAIPPKTSPVAAEVGGSSAWTP